MQREAAEQTGLFSPVEVPSMIASNRQGFISETKLQAGFPSSLAASMQLQQVKFVLRAHTSRDFSVCQPCTELCWYCEEARILRRGTIPTKRSTDGDDGEGTQTRHTAAKS